MLKSILSAAAVCTMVALILGGLAVRAFRAGSDIICTPYGYHSYTAILKAVKSGKISRERLDRSVRRIIRLKIDKGII